MLSIASITKLINGVPLYEGVSFQINPGEKVGLVGANGTGKTSLFNLIVGTDKPDEGQISLDKSCRMAYFSQKVGEMRGRTALAEVVSGNERINALSQTLKADELPNFNETRWSISELINV